MKKFEFLEHTADVKIRTRGSSREEIFENFVLAVSEYLSRGKKIKKTRKIVRSVQGNDREDLLYNFLDEIIYLLDAENFVVSEAEVFFEDSEFKMLKAVFHGDDAEKHSDLDHVKAATYSEMHFRETSDGWEAQAVLDV